MSEKQKSSSDDKKSIDVRAIVIGELEQESFPEVKQGFRVFISEDAFDRAVERGGKDTTREIGGVLVGVVRRDDAGPYVRVDTTIDALHAEEKGAELTFTHDTWQHIHEQMDTVHKKKRLVGWYHTHPGFGIFLSDRDEFIHHSFFDAPFQVAMVYDPKSREHGVFTWHEGGLRRARRYWIGEHEHTWDGSRHGAGKKGESEAAAAVPDTGESGRYRPDDGFFGGGGVDWFGIALLGLVLVLVSGWLGHCMGKQGGQQLVAEAEHKLDEARALGAVEAVQAINVELVGAVRAAVDEQSAHRDMEEIVSALDDALALLEDRPAATGADSPEKDDKAGDTGTADKAGADTGDDAAGKAAAPKSDARQGRKDKLEAAIKQARRRARQVARKRLKLAETLQKYSGLRRGVDSAERQQLKVHRSALGTLYAELAADLAKSGEKRRAARYLQTAAQIDPGGYERYLKQLRTFDDKTKLPRTAPSRSGRAEKKAAKSQKSSEKNNDRAGHDE